MCAWLSGWIYRKSHTINGSTAGAQTDYQVKITVHYGSGTDSGGDVYLNSHCRTDFGDVRFTSDDGTTLLSYWMESKTDGDNAVFWVKIPSIPASPNTTTIHIYYGNPNATTTSNGDNTFLFFDDFLGTTLNTSKWSTEWLYGASYSVSNSIITITSAGTRPYIHTVGTFTAPFAIEARVQKINGNIEFCWFVTSPFYGSGGNAPQTAYQLADAIWASPESIRIIKSDNKVWTTLASTTLSVATGWHRMVVIQRTTGIVGYVDSTSVSTTDVSYQSGNVCLSNREPSGDQQAFDWIFVRKYADPEPSHGAWGSEATYAAISVSDSGSGADSMSLLTMINISDSGSGSDSANVKPVTVITVSDSGVGSDMIGRYLYEATAMDGYVVVKDWSGNEHTLIPMYMRVRKSNEYAGDFDVKISDIREPVSVLTWLDVGQEIALYVKGKYVVGDGTEVPDKDWKILLGAIEDIEVQIPTPSERYVLIKGRDKFSLRANEIVITETYRNKDVVEIVNDLISSYMPEYTIINTENSGVVLEDVRFRYRYLKDVLDILATACGYTYWGDEEKRFYFVPLSYEDSGFEVDDTLVIEHPEIRISVVPTKNVVYVIGGKGKQEDQKFEQHSSYVDLNENYWAQEFKPSVSDLSQISLYLEKVGNPDFDLAGYIAKDDGGKPGEKVMTFVYDKDYVEAGWYPIGVKASLVPDESYWIVLEKEGDEMNHYRWYYGTDSSNTLRRAYSTDKVNWAVSQDNCMSYKTYYDIPVVVRAANQESIMKHGERVLLITDDNITDINTAKAIAQAKLDEVGKKYIEVREIKARGTYPIPQPGKTITLNLSRAGINDKFLIKEVEVELEGGRTNVGVRMRLGDTLTRLFSYLAWLARNLDATRVGIIGAGELLNLYRQILESVNLTDSVTTTVTPSGSFVVDTAEVDFSDIAESET